MIDNIQNKYSNRLKELRLLIKWIEKDSKEYNELKKEKRNIQKRLKNRRRKQERRRDRKLQEKEKRNNTGKKKQLKITKKEYKYFYQKHIVDKRRIDLGEYTTYNKYLESDYWKGVREYYFRLRGKKCEMCNDNKRLQLHHISYFVKGVEIDYPEYLMIVCDTCHSLIHSSNKKEYKDLDPIRNPPLKSLKTFVNSIGNVKKYKARKSRIVKRPTTEKEPPKNVNEFISNLFG